MKQRFVGVVIFAVGLGIGLSIGWTLRPSSSRVNGGSGEGAETVQLTLSADIDGTDRFVFTREEAWNEHGMWSRPKNVFLQGQPWSDLSKAPDVWKQMAQDLDLTKATILVRKGRDIIGLESTPEGFDVYFADTLDGKSRCEVTISIPRLVR